MPPPDFSQSENNLGLPVKYLVKRPPVFIEPGATVTQAARAMREALIGSVLVADDPPGIITDRDLRGRVLAAGLGPETPVRQVMTRPLKTLDSDAPVFMALQLMLEEHIHHLALVEEGKIIGVISSTDLLRHEATGAFYLRRTLDSVENPAALAHYSREVAGMVQTLFRGGLGAVQIGQIVSSLNDALVKRLVSLAEQALGTPPTDFAWIVFGSEGRLEQTLLTDQDNALIYGEESEAARAYFKLLGERVVNGLIQVGFPPCAGDFMATRWCKPLEQWRRLFAGWVRTPEPQALLEAAIFFDFRPVAGSLSLAPLEDILAAARNRKALHRARGARSIEVEPAARFLQPDTQRPWHGRSEKRRYWADCKPGARRCAGSRITRTINSGATGRSGKIRGSSSRARMTFGTGGNVSVFVASSPAPAIGGAAAQPSARSQGQLDAFSTLEHRHLKEGIRDDPTDSRRHSRQLAY